MRIQLCGVRGSTPVGGEGFGRYGGHTSCLAVSKQDEPPQLILDAGTGLIRAAALFAGRPFAGTILLSHLHWDHTQGLPFFSPADTPDARVDVLAPAQGDIAAALERMMSPPSFPIVPSQLRGHWRFNGIEEGRQEIEGFSVDAREIPHKGGRTMAYRITDGNASFAYAPDHWPLGLGPGDEGFGEYHPAIREVAEGVDLLIHDAQYSAEELAAKADFGHSVADYAVGLAVKCQARRVLLFHHDPFHKDSDIDRIVEHCRNVANGRVVVDAAIEGDIVEVGAQ